MKNKCWRVKGTRKTEEGLGFQTDTLKAKSWNKAVKKARAMGFGVKSDFDVKKLKDNKC